MRPSFWRFENSSRFVSSFLLTLICKHRTGYVRLFVRSSVTGTSVGRCLARSGMCGILSTGRTRRCAIQCQRDENYLRPFSLSLLLGDPTIQMRHAALDSDPDGLFYKTVESANVMGLPKAARFEWFVSAGASARVLHVWLELVSCASQGSFIF